MKKNNKKASGEALIVAGIFCLVLAIALSVLGLQKPAELKEVSKISPEEMSDDYAYHFDDLIVCNYYMKQSGAESGNGRYYIAAIYDKGVYYLASVYADNDETLRATLREYADDKTAEIGDLVLSGCFSAQKVSSVENLDEFYDETAEDHIALFADENLDAVDLQLHLTYVCEAAEDYEKTASSTDLLYLGIIFLVIGAPCVFFGIRMRKKGLAELAGLEEFRRSQQDEPWDKI